MPRVPGVSYEGRSDRPSITTRNAAHHHAAAPLDTLPLIAQLHELMVADVTVLSQIDRHIHRQSNSPPLIAVTRSRHSAASSTIISSGRFVARRMTPPAGVDATSAQPPLEQREARRKNVRSIDTPGLP